jgi:hypothetical protein
MGLFRFRAKRNRETVAATLVADEVAAKLPAEPTNPPAPVEAARREVTAEARPNPDQPGWGRIAGQAIGKAREDRQD